VARVTGLTAERMLGIEAASVVDGEINESGHLILERHDGTEIDAGSALATIPISSTTVQGIVELATSAETAAHVDASRAVTPASLAATMGRITDAETAAFTTLGVNIHAEADLATVYPIGTSNMTIVSGGWTVGDGTVVTIRNFSGSDRHLQWFHVFNTNATYKRYFYSGAWGPWALLATPSLPETMGIPGEIKMWAGIVIPAGWKLCDGTTVGRTAAAGLFAAIGTTYGVGNGTTTFNVPNLKGRVPVGVDGAQTEFDSLGETGGAKTHTLTTPEMPSHTHTQNPHTHLMQGTGALTDGSSGTSFVVPSGSFYGFRTDQPNDTTAVNNATGGGGAHNNLQPYLAINYIIKL
jgi:microcystin-dependent protein